jgi:hypothetical protein
LEEQMMRDETEMEEMASKTPKKKKDPRYIELEAWTGSADGDLTNSELPLVIEKGARVGVFVCDLRLPVC